MSHHYWERTIAVHGSLYVLVKSLLLWLNIASYCTPLLSSVGSVFSSCSCNSMPGTPAIIRFNCVVVVVSRFRCRRRRHKSHPISSNFWSEREKRSRGRCSGLRWNGQQVVSGWVDRYIKWSVSAGMLHVQRVVTVSSTIFGMTDISPTRVKYIVQDAEPWICCTSLPATYRTCFSFLS